MKCLMNVCYLIWNNALSYIAFCHMNDDTLLNLILYYIWMSFCCVAMFAQLHMYYIVYTMNIDFMAVHFSHSLFLLFSRFHECIARSPGCASENGKPVQCISWLQISAFHGPNGMSIWHSSLCANTPNLCMQGLVQHWMDPISISSGSWITIGWPWLFALLVILQGFTKQ